MRDNALLSCLLLILFSAPLFAVDEDYFIPYTDNYGYEYDPETGTYIQTEPDTSVTPHAIQQSTQQPAIDNTVNGAVDQINPRPQVMNGDNRSTIHFALFLASLTGILMLSFILAKLFRKQGS